MNLNSQSKILVVGLGLIGGSYAAALREKGFEVGAIDPDGRAIDFALEKGFISSGRTQPDAEYLCKFDIAVLALYPHFRRYVRRKLCARHGNERGPLQYAGRGADGGYDRGRHAPDGHDADLQPDYFPGALVYASVFEIPRGRDFVGDRFGRVLFRGADAVVRAVTAGGRGNRRGQPRRLCGFCADRRNPEMSCFFAQTGV